MSAAIVGRCGKSSQVPAILNDTVYEIGASPPLYEVELNTTENQVTETVIYGNIQLVKHTTTRTRMWPR